MLISLLGKLMFEKISLFCGNRHTQIPVTFVLGFYVSLLVTRWWKQFETIPWPDSSAVWISTCIKGHDDKSRLMRRTIIRDILLDFCLSLPEIFIWKYWKSRSGTSVSRKVSKKAFQYLPKFFSFSKLWIFRKIAKLWIWIFMPKINEFLWFWYIDFCYNLNFDAKNVLWIWIFS